MSWPLVFLFASSMIANPSAETDSTTHHYSETIDLSQNPGVDEYKVLARNRLLFLCQTPQGCTLQMKIDGPCGSGGATEQVQIAADGLSFTSTSSLEPPPPPRVDGNGRNQFLIYVRRDGKTPDLAVCVVSDQDDGPGHADSGPGFSMNYAATGSCAGNTVCRVDFTEASPR